jgi:hypothetical protein|tara:strand:+ start:305 stop:730 length:426 start_codon:yes stop_codon:yes gene_type:complete
MSETLSRTLKRDKPKAHIVEGMTKLFFQKTDAKEAIISIKENRQTRTGLQNNLYWGVVIEQVRLETRNSKDAIHNHLREELLEVTWETVGKRSNQVLKSTTTMNTKEMGTYIDDCILYIQGELLPGFKLNLPDNWKGLVVE